MNQEKTGSLIRQLRQEQNLTQHALGAALGVSNQAVSKWERGRGLPDVSLLGVLAELLFVPVETLLSGQLSSQDHQGAALKETSFFLCPQCRNIVTTSGRASLSCCDRQLEPLHPLPPDSTHDLVIEHRDNQLYLTSSHPMTKEHHILFTALVTAEQVILLRSWAEWDYQQRMPAAPRGRLYWLCTRHGLFYRNLSPAYQRQPRGQ